MSDYWLNIGDLVEDRVINEHTVDKRMGIVLRVDAALTVNATYMVHWNGYGKPLPYKDWEIRKVDKK
jgi:hypothetical protein